MKALSINSLKTHWITYRNPRTCKALKPHEPRPSLQASKIEVGSSLVPADRNSECPIPARERSIRISVGFFKHLIQLFLSSSRQFHTLWCTDKPVHPKACNGALRSSVKRRNPKP